jgi:hypothetical protein
MAGSPGDGVASAFDEADAARRYRANSAGAKFVVSGPGTGALVDPQPARYPWLVDEHDRIYSLMGPRSLSETMPLCARPTPASSMKWLTACQPTDRIERAVAFTWRMIQNPASVSRGIY